MRRISLRLSLGFLVFAALSPTLSAAEKPKTAASDPYALAAHRRPHRQAVGRAKNQADDSCRRRRSCAGSIST